MCTIQKEALVPHPGHRVGVGRQADEEQIALHLPSLVSTFTLWGRA